MYRKENFRDNMDSIDQKIFLRMKKEKYTYATMYYMLCAMTEYSVYYQYVTNAYHIHVQRTHI